MHDDTVSSGSDATLASGRGAHGSAELVSSRRELGSIIANDYRIEGHLGAGAMGLVYLARHVRLDRLVALKDLLVVDDGGTERMLREAMAMARLDHPNVVRVFDARQLDGRLFIVMEYVPGGTLRTWRERMPRTHRAILDMYVKAAEGLAAAHAMGIVHRDFKPDNVLVTGKGEPKVADFGLARASLEDVPGPAPTPSADPRWDANLTRTGALMGTPAYMAPEQYAGQADARSDQFAFCVALYEALYGRRPFPGRSIFELLQQVSRGHIERPSGTKVPGEVLDVLIQGLRPDPAQRHASMDALVRALRHASAPRGPLALAIASAAVLAVGAVAGVWWAWAPPEREPEVDGALEASVSAPQDEPIKSPAPDRVADRAPEPMAEPKAEARTRPPTEVAVVAPEGPKYRTWDGSKPYVCSKRHDWYVGVTARPEGEAVIIAEDGCDFRCQGCTLEGKVIVVARGNAHVEIGSSTLGATETVVVAKDDGVVRIGAGSEVTMSPTGPAFALEDRAQLSLSRISVTAPIGARVTGSAVLTLEDTTLEGSKAAIEAGSGTTIRDFGATFVGPVTINGTHERTGKD